MSRARDLADGTFSGALVAASADLTGAVEAASFSDGTNSVGGVYLTRGSAKAWVNFNGTGTIAARDSLNLSSLTDNGVGNYTVSLTSAFSAANYVSSNGATSSDNIFVGIATTRTTTNYVVKTNGATGTALDAIALADHTTVDTLVMGDLA